jgi:hypothetical protein
MRADLESSVTEAQELTGLISQLLAGRDFAIQSAVIADLAATWLAGIQGEHKHDVRIRMLQNFLEQVIRLVPVNEAELLAAVEKRKAERRH